MDPILFFLTFLKASALAIGGLAPLALLRQDMVLPGIVSEQDVVTALAIGRFAPGPNGLWIVSFGYLAAGWPGAALALAAACLPPLTLVVITVYGRRALMSSWANGVVRGASLSAGGLLIAIGVGLLSPDPAALPAVAFWQLALAVVAMVLIYVGRPHPGLVVAAGALAGLVFGRA